MASQRSTWSRDAAGSAASRACCLGVKGRACAGDEAGPGIEMAKDLAEGVPSTGTTASARGRLGKAGVGPGTDPGAGRAGIGGGGAEERAGSENWDSGRLGRAGGAGGAQGLGMQSPGSGLGSGSGESLVVVVRTQIWGILLALLRPRFLLRVQPVWGGPPAGLRGGSNRFGGVACSARQVSQITRPVGLLRPVLDPDPAGRLEGCQGIPDGLGAAAQVLGQPAVGRPAGVPGPGVFE